MLEFPFEFSLRRFVLWFCITGMGFDVGYKAINEDSVLKPHKSAISLQFPLRNMLEK